MIDPARILTPEGHGVNHEDAICSLSPARPCPTRHRGRTIAASRRSGRREERHRYAEDQRQAGGRTLGGKKAVAKGTSAFDAVRHVVAMAYRMDPEVGPVVTSLCGVSAPKGSAWACSIDGQACRNPGSVGVNADLTIEWKTVPAR